jgi:hypothetical protein
MRFQLGLPLKLIFSIGVVAVSFWITLTALDYWYPSLGNRSDTPIPQAPAPQPIFTLNTAKPNWTVISPSTTTVSVTSKGISLESKMPTNGYQWQTDLITTQTNTGYTISYEVEVTKGKMGIGVLDVVNDKFIASKEIGARLDTIAFTASSAQIRVILSGRSPPPTAAAISSLAITGPPKQ